MHARVAQGRPAETSSAANRMQPFGKASTRPKIQPALWEPLWSDLQFAGDSSGYQQRRLCIGRSDTYASYCSTWTISGGGTLTEQDVLVLKMAAHDCEIDGRKRPFSSAGGGDVRIGCAECPVFDQQPHAF
jgi:hypothetical protein